MDNRGSIKKQSIVGGFAILSIAGILSKLLSVVYQPVLNGILGLGGFGLYGATYLIYVYFYTICNSGLPNSISKLVSEEVALNNEKKAHRIFILSRRLLIFVGGVLSLIMFIGSDALAAIMGYPDISLAVKVLSPAVFLTAILSSYKGYFQGQKFMTPTGVSQILEQLANVFFSLLFAYLLINMSGVVEGVAGATTGTSIGAFIAILVMFWYYKKNKHYEYSIDKEEDKKLLKRIIFNAAPITICMAIQGLAPLIDPAILKWRLSSIDVPMEVIKANLGMIVQYNTLINVPIALAMALAVAVLPSVASLRIKGQNDLLKNRIDFSIKLCLLITIPCVVGLSTLAYSVCKILTFDDGTAVLLIYGSSILLLMSLIQILTAVMQGINKLYTITIISIISVCVKLTINYFTITEFGYIGVLIGNGMAFLMVVILSTMTINKTVGRNIRILRSAQKPIIASVIMGIVVWSTNKIIFIGLSIVISNYIANAIAVFMSIMIGIIVYGMAILMIGGLSKEEIDAMPNKVRRLIPKRFLR